MGKNKITNGQAYNENRNILIEEYKSIYFFIPKNGCTSFKKHLFHLVGDDNYQGPIHKAPFPFADINKLSVGYENYMKFTFVRNPWSRLVSCYNSKIRSADFTDNYFLNGIHRGFRRYAGLFYGQMPFHEFVDAVCSIPDSEADAHFVSQLYWLTDSSGELLPNYIGRLENLDIAIEDIYQQTGLSFQNMKHRNQSNNSTPYTEYYDESLKEKVQERFAGDIEIFGYEFEPNPDIKHIGFIDDTFRQRLANSTHLIPILKEKCAQLEMNHQKEMKLKRKTISALKEELTSMNDPNANETFYLKKELAQKEKTIEALQNSLSWKITRPLRMAVSLFRMKS